MDRPVLTWLIKSPGRLTDLGIDHERFHLPSVIDMELEGAKELMAHLPGGRNLLTIGGDAEFVLALKRLVFLREFNSFSR